MSFLSRLLLRIGYVRLRDYGYTLTTEGRIVELPRVTDDRFAPPPWEPIAWQSATAFLPPTAPPVPRPLAPPPHPESRDGAGHHARLPETPVPAVAPISGVIVPAPGPAAGPHSTAHPMAPHAVAPHAVAPHPMAPHPMAPAAPVRTEAEEEEWEWRVALARARERAAREAAAVRNGGRARTVPPVLPALQPRSATQIGAGPTRAPAGGDHGGPVAGRSGQVFVPAPPAHTSSMLTPPGVPLRVEGADFADGSNTHPVTREPDTTATDVAAIAPGGRDEEDTTVDATANRLGRTLRAESDPHGTNVDTSPSVPLGPPPGLSRAISERNDAPLPRLTTRLRRPTSVR
jgi:hypothetical protein